MSHPLPKVQVNSNFLSINEIDCSLIVESGESHHSWIHMLILFSTEMQFVMFT